MTGQSEKAKKKETSILITAITSVRFPKPVSTDPKINLDLVLTNQIEKDGMRGWSMKKNMYRIRYFYRDIVTRRMAKQD